MILSFTRRFCMAHRLRHSGSKRCSTPHGHNESVTARLSYCGDRELDTSSNVAADFSELKHEWHTWIDNYVDHSLQIADDDPLLDYFRANEPEQLPHILTTPGDPSTELVSALFLSKYTGFLQKIGAPFEVASIEVCETPTNTVVIQSSDLVLFPALERAGWWHRADHSINDLQYPSDQAASLTGNASLTSV